MSISNIIYNVHVRTQSVFAPNERYTTGPSDIVVGAEDIRCSRHPSVHLSHLFACDVPLAVVIVAVAVAFPHAGNCAAGAHTLAYFVFSLPFLVDKLGYTKFIFTPVLRVPYTCTRIHVSVFTIFDYYGFFASDEFDVSVVGSNIRVGVFVVGIHSPHPTSSPSLPYGQTLLSLAREDTWYCVDGVLSKPYTRFKF